MSSCITFWTGLCTWWISSSISSIFFYMTSADFHSKGEPRLALVHCLKTKNQTRYNARYLDIGMMTGKQPTTKNIQMFRTLKLAQSALEGWDQGMVSNVVLTPLYPQAWTRSSLKSSCSMATVLPDHTRNMLLMRVSERILWLILIGLSTIRIYSASVTYVKRYFWNPLKITMVSKGIVTNMFVCVY